MEHEVHVDVDVQRNVVKNIQPDVICGYQEDALPDTHSDQLALAAISARVLASLGLREETELVGTPASIDDLVEALKGSDDTAKIAAIHALIARVSQVQQHMHLYLHIEFVRIALLDHKWEHQIAAIHAIGVYGTTQSISALKICLQHFNAFVRAAAIDMIAKIGTRVHSVYSGKQLNDTITLLLAAASDEHSFVRTAVMQAMRVFGLRGIGKLEFLNAVFFALDDEEWTVRVAAIRTLYVLQGNQALPRLASIAQRDSEFLVRDAAQTLLDAAIKSVLPLERPQPAPVPVTLKPVRILPLEKEAYNGTIRTFTDEHNQHLSFQDEHKTDRPLQKLGFHQSLRQCFYRKRARIQTGREAPHVQKHPSLKKSVRTSTTVFLVMMMIIFIIAHGLTTGWSFANTVSPSFVSSVVVQPDQTFSLPVAIKNTSASTWSNTQGYTFICTTHDPGTNDCMGQADIAFGTETIPPNQLYVRTISLQAPSISGNYMVEWTLKRGNTIISEVYIVIYIIVECPQNGTCHQKGALSAEHTTHNIQRIVISICLFGKHRRQKNGDIVS